MNPIIVEYLRNNGVLTGSRVFGKANRFSDYDYILTDEQYHVLCSLLDKEKITYLKNRSSSSKKSSHSVKFEIGSSTYDVFSFQDHTTYLAWVNATGWMTHLAKESIVFRGMINKKERRVRIFETLCYWYESFMTTIPVNWPLLK